MRNASIRSAASSQKDPDAIVRELTQAWAGMSPTAIAFFTGHTRDGAAISAALRRAFPGTPNVGCTTAGELTQHHEGRQTTSALALGAGKVRRASAALATFDDGVRSGVARGMHALARGLDVDLKTADPRRFVGITLVEGLRRNEEECNEALGDGAPLLSFVGGSAGDDAEFAKTRVFADGEESDNGAALLLLDAAVPFVVGKTCSFEPTGVRFTVTKANVAERIVYELDGEPVATAYARAAGVEPNRLDASVFMTHPVGLMVDGAPWIRSPQQLLPDGGLRFYCRIEQGMTVDLMRSTPLVDDTRRALGRWAEELGAPIAGGFAFNCILRRLELDATGQGAAFRACFEGMEMAGFHTYGESWLAHINQTLTTLLFA